MKNQTKLKKEEYFDYQKGKIMNNIVLSIHPKWAKLIYKSDKRIEWRKTAPKKLDKSTKVYLYETSPVCKITGYIVLQDIEKFDVKNGKHLKGLRRNYKKAGCVSHKELCEYQGNKDYIYAWNIKTFVKFIKPVSLTLFDLKRPPQSWCYTDGRLYEMHLGE